MGSNIRSMLRRFWQEFLVQNHDKTVREAIPQSQKMKNIPRKKYFLFKSFAIIKK